MIMRETIDKYLQQTDPLAYLESNDKESLVEAKVNQVEEEFEDLQQSTPVPKMSGDYIQDVATLNAINSQMRELAMPQMPSMETQRQTNRVFWARWAQLHPQYVKTEVLELLTRWEEVFDSRPIDEVGPQVFEANNPICWEETLPDSLDSQTLVEQWTMFTQPLIEDYIQRAILNPFLPVDCAQWDLTAQELTLSQVKQKLDSIKRLEPLMTIVLADQDKALDLLADQIRLELIDEPLPRWISQWETRSGNQA